MTSLMRVTIERQMRVERLAMLLIRRWVMNTFTEKLGVIENLGVVDRSLRALAGVVLLAPIVIAVVQVTAIGWQFYAGIASCYLLLTAMLGWDPFYALFGARSCGLSERHRCGSFQYETDAILGHHPEQDKGYEAHALKPQERVVGVNYEGYIL